jgi:hypothetical protein
MLHVRPDGIAFGCVRDPEGLGALAARLKPLSPCLVVLEATTGSPASTSAAATTPFIPAAHQPAQGARVRRRHWLAGQD